MRRCLASDKTEYRAELNTMKWKLNLIALFVVLVSTQLLFSSSAQLESAKECARTSLTHPDCISCCGRVLKSCDPPCWSNGRRCLSQCGVAAHLIDCAEGCLPSPKGGIFVHACLINCGISGLAITACIEDCAIEKDNCHSACLDDDSVCRTDCDQEFITVK